MTISTLMLIKSEKDNPCDYSHLGGLQTFERTTLLQNHVKEVTAVLLEKIRPLKFAQIRLHNTGSVNAWETESRES